CSERRRRRVSTRLFFSSTCATYGIPISMPMKESHAQMPINPYGRSKLIIEQILRDLDLYQGFRFIILRYFNAAGADPLGRIGEWHSPETHARPMTRATGPACEISSTSSILP